MLSRNIVLGISDHTKIVIKNTVLNEISIGFFSSEPGKDVKIIFKNKKWWSSRKNNYYSQAKLIV